MYICIHVHISYVMFMCMFISIHIIFMCMFISVHARLYLCIHTCVYAARGDGDSARRQVTCEPQFAFICCIYDCILTCIFIYTCICICSWRRQRQNSKIDSLRTSAPSCHSRVPRSTGIHIHTHIYVHIYIYIYEYSYVYVLYM